MIKISLDPMLCMGVYMHDCMEWQALHPELMYVFPRGSVGIS